jgi:hypothetical protein
MVGFYLALIIASTDGTYFSQPQVLGAFPEGTKAARACHETARQLNKQIARRPEAVQKGVEAVCLVVTRGVQV